MDARNEDFRLKAKQLYDRAFDYMLEDNAYLLFTVKNFRDASTAISDNIPKDEWTGEDYELMMRSSLLIINNILQNDNQKKFSASVVTDHAMEMYKSADHDKLTLDYYLAAYEASVNLAGKKAHDALRGNAQGLTVAKNAAYAKQAEEIARQLWNKMGFDAALADDQMRQLAHADINLAYIQHASGQLDKALMNAVQAIHSFVSVSDFDSFDLHKLADVYGDMARMFAFDPAYATLFQFASDLFRGDPAANFRKFEEAVYAVTRQPDAGYQRTQILLQLMRLWDAKHELMVDESTFGNEMKETYCQERFKEILEGQEAVASKYLQDFFDPNQSDLFRRADDVMNAKFPTFDELLAQADLDINIPSLDEVAMPAPGLLAKHSLLKAENNTRPAPKPGVGWEIPVKFGPNL